MIFQRHLGCGDLVLTKGAATTPCWNSAFSRSHAMAWVTFLEGECFAFGWVPFKEAFDDFGFGGVDVVDLEVVPDEVGGCVKFGVASR